MFWLVEVNYLHENGFPIFIIVEYMNKIALITHMPNSASLALDGVGYISAKFCMVYTGMQRHLDSGL